MPPPNNSLDRPLGQSIGPRPAARKRISWGGLVLGLTGIVLFVSSGAIALRDRPFRTPPPIASAEPPAATPTAAEAAPVKPVGDGPQIIKVDPEAPRPADNVVIVRDPSAIGQNLRVAHLPDKALIEDSETGPLPIRAADGRRPFDVYARPWSGARGARVAIVIGGLGVSQTGTQEAVRKLPPEVTLAFASGGNSLGRWMQAARQKGHEIVMQVPLEPYDYPNVDPGRNTLTVAASSRENLAALRWALSRITNYTGVMNYMGARFSADPSAMAPVMDELAKRGLLYLDDGSSARSIAPELAMKAGVPFAVGDTAIDAVRERGDILNKLDELERIARAKGFAIGIGAAFDVTVDAVASWVQEAKKRGIEIVSVSAIASDPERG
ncbi:divergent polysaccharide deacetylase family protein [Mesorhizobium sp. 1B3]|uniref:divergent polysaccharide deacetylase family protein n=1 Tax=Mesorhizobium sp. 1B3 TaxID=3243599 RepID=UPI003D9833B2